MLRLLGTSILFLFCLFQPAYAQEAAPAPEVSDVRVLVDISGSMKKNDPQNLRIPAVSLLAQLLPDAHQAGVWTFGQQVNMLVKQGKVDPAWRKIAQNRARQINSVALFTNIGGVLEKASADFVAGQNYPNTHFILLTDGVVDISKNPEDNVRERQRILSSVVSKFKAAGARIHTVALSREADTNLLDKLALETGGMAAVAESPEDLSRFFVQALDQAVPQIKVPLNGNRFQIDGSIQEFTALVFTKAGAAPVALVDPDGNRHSSEKHASGIKWHRDRGYDLLTVSQPAKGEWLLEADLQPGSRVTVVTNLQMIVNQLPAQFHPGDALELAVSFQEDSSQITSAEFLGVIDVDVTITNEENLSGTKRVSVPGQPPQDGVYRESISRLKRMGTYSVTVLADGKTFQREHSQSIQLRSPVDMELEGTGAGQDSRYLLTVIPRSDNIVAAESQVSLTISAPDGGQYVKTVPFVAEHNRWELLIEPQSGEGQYLVQASIDGALKGGQRFQMQPGAMSLDYPRKEGQQGSYQSMVTPASAEQAVAAVNQAAEQEKGTNLAGDETPLVDLAAAAQGQANGEGGFLMGDESSTEATAPKTELWLWGGLIALVFVGVAGGMGVILKKRRAGKASEMAATPVAEKATDKAPPAKPAPVEEDTDIDDELELVGELEPSMAMTGVAASVLTGASALAADTHLDEKSPEELADEILAENQKTSAEPEEEFNLEDFDISDTDGLPQLEK